MNFPARVTIVGCGLMGGSLALALRPHLHHLTLVDNNLANLAAAAPLADFTTDNFTAGVKEADLVILATPVRVILSLLEQLPQVRPQGCFVLDLGSTKQAISAAMEQLPPVFQAIGGHPMCGKTQTGFAAATPDLYRGRTFVLCPTSRTTPAVTAIAQQLITWVEASPITLTPTEHDAIVATTSHLPYLVAANLMAVVAAAAAQQEHLYSVSAAGLRDTTRLAASDPSMMLDILLTNRTAVLERLDETLAGLQEVKQLLSEGNAAALQQWLETRQGERGHYEINRR
jgi:prephenate dehydrogenase